MPNLNTSHKAIFQQTVGQFDVLGCVKWLSNATVEETRNGEFELRETILYDHSSHIKFTVWDKFITAIQENTWYSFSDLVIKSYYGCKLSITKRMQVSINNEEILPTLRPELMNEYLEDQN